MAQADQAYHPLRTIVELIVVSAISAGCFAYAAKFCTEDRRAWATGPFLFGAKEMDANRAALVVAQQMAIKAVKEGLRRQGVRITYVKHCDLIVLANHYLVRHHDEIVASAMSGSG
jgi:hypothetical protein